MNPTNMMPAPNQQPSPDQPFPLPTERWQQIGTHSFPLTLWSTMQGEVFHTQSKHWSNMGLPQPADVLECHEKKRFFEMGRYLLSDNPISDRLAVGTRGHFSQRHGPHHQGLVCGEAFETFIISFEQIHNTNNENAWGEVLKWERFHKAECPEPQVRHFDIWYDTLILGVRTSLIFNGIFRIWLSVEKLWRQG